MKRFLSRVCKYGRESNDPTPGKLKNQPDHGGNRTRDLWFASPKIHIILETY